MKLHLRDSARTHREWQHPEKKAALVEYSFFFVTRELVVELFVAIRTIRVVI